MKKTKMLLVAAVAALALFGCQGGLTKTSTFSPSQSSIFVTRDNLVSSALVESYESDGYDQEELKQYVEAAVIAYNTAHGADAEAANIDGLGRLPVALKSCVLENKKAVVIFDYASGADLLQFAAETNDTVHQLKTLEANNVTNGLPTDLTLITAKDKAKADVGKIQAKGELHVITMEGKATVQTEGKVLYITDGVSLTDDYTVVTPEGKSCIIFE